MEDVIEPRKWCHVSFTRKPKTHSQKLFLDGKGLIMAKEANEQKAG